MTPWSPEEFKQATRQAWEQSADGWDRQTPLIHDWLLAATEELLDAARVTPGMRVLDVAAGAGDQTLAIARRVGPDGHVLATDISEAMVRLTQAHARQAGLAHIEARAADAELLTVPAGSFDAAVCRLGLMFCPDPVHALRQMQRALRPGGHAAVLVFSEPQRNPCLGIVMSTALRHAGLGPRDPFQPGGLLSLGRPGLLEECFAQAGFDEVVASRIHAPMQLPSAHDYLNFVRTSASPILQILGHLNLQAREEAWADMQEQLDVFDLPEGGWEGPNELLLVRGMRPPR